MTKNHILGLDIAQHSAVAQLNRADGSKCWRGTRWTLMIDARSFSGTKRIIQLVASGSAL